MNDIDNAIASVNRLYDFAVPWLLDHGVRIIAIIVIAYIVKKSSNVAIEKIVRRAVPPQHFLSPEAEKKREDTLIRIFGGTIGVLLWVFVGMMVLGEAGIEIGPLLAGAGVAGLALGFGGQYLIRDVIAGLFIILENQYRVGDIVCLDGTCGSVEDITLRSTVLRDLDGVVHHIQNGSIGKTSNLSKDFARINLDVGVAYDTDLEKAIGVINEVGNELARDPEWRKHIRKAPQFLRVNNFGDSAIDLKIVGETEPLKQWAATGELRKRLKSAFDKAGIEIPFPQRVIHQARK